MKILVMSDIHGNLEALKSVLKSVDREKISHIINLGDMIDYGPHSSEVVEIIEKIDIPILCNLYGNHEDSIFNDCYECFSSVRGCVSAKYTKKQLGENAKKYIQYRCEKSGKKILELDKKKILCVHGSLEDPFWKTVNYNQDMSEYKMFDYVLSGHSHIPHYFEKYFDINNPRYRNKKKTVFLNPGSVGQPRNQNPMAQFSIWDTITDEVSMKKVSYDIKKEQSAFSDEVDRFYSERLEVGI